MPAMSRQEMIEYASAITAALERLEDTDCSKYADDAEGFIEQVLGETLTDDLREICRSVVKYPVTIAQSGNGTGKSWIEARIALWFFKCRVEPQVYCCAAPPQGNLERILWAEISSLIDKQKLLCGDCTTKNLQIERNPREFIAGVTIPTAGTDAQKQARFSGKHAPSLLFLVDEGDAVPDPIYAGIETCLSGGFDRLFITFNPRERRGHVYRTIKSGQANVIKLSAFNHPSVITGKDLFPGAVNREKTLRRIAQWTRPLAPGEAIDKGCFEVPSFLVGCVPTDQKGRALEPIAAGWRKITEHQFSHVVLGEYPAQADNQLISEEWIDQARSRYDLFVAKHGVIVPEHIRCTAGLDIAEFGKDSSVLALRFGNFLHPLQQWSKMDVIEVGDLVKDYFQRCGIVNINAIYCDSTGAGSGTAPYMTRQYALPAVRVMVANASKEKTDLGEFRTLNDQLPWEVREWLRTDQAMLPPDPDLIEELLAFTYEVKNGKVCVSGTDDVKALLGRSPDKARAVMLSFMKSGFFSKADLS